MAEAAQIVEGMGADIVDVNMGCPVPKIAKHNAGCSLMREPEHAATVIGAMAKAVNDSGDGEDARRLERLVRAMRRTSRGGCRMPGRRRSPSTVARPSSPTAATPIGISCRRWQAALSIPVLGSGDCVEPGQIIERLTHVAAGGPAHRGTADRPGGGRLPACWWAAACCATRGSWRRRRTSQPAARRASSRWSSAASSCWITSRCCATNA